MENKSPGVTPELHTSTTVTSAEWLIVALGAALLFAATLNARQLQSANDRSRWCTVWSLVERGTYQIDEIDKKSGWTTIDKVLHDGHLYSSKPPLQSTAVAGVYWVLKKSVRAGPFEADY